MGDNKAAAGTVKANPEPVQYIGQPKSERVADVAAAAVVKKQPVTVLSL